MYKVHGTIFPNASYKYYWHYLLPSVLLCTYIGIMTTSILLSKNEEIRLESGRDVVSDSTQTYLVGFRFFFWLMGICGAAFFLMRPSRTVSSILADPVRYHRFFSYFIPFLGI